MCPAVAYEMLVSHSPPVFSHSPPGFLHHHHTHDLLRFNSTPTWGMPPTQCRAKMPGPLTFATKPCLVIRPEDPPSPDDGPSSPTRLKKKVVFADDRGMSLTHVRVMTEPSNVPPLWSCRFLAEVTRGVTAEAEAQAEPWEVTFAQPASDYVDFRRRLDSEKVSLENVIVKEGEEMVVGTVKVSNLSFHKEVVIRVTVDQWKSFEDAFCTFVPNAVPSAAYVLYDTFSFKVPLPVRAKRMEFCVCFRCDGKEYWDSNKGKNYVILKKSPVGMHKSYSADDVYRKNQINSSLNKERTPSNAIPIKKSVDAAHAKMSQWSEFASWTHLDNSGPYW